MSENGAEISESGERSSILLTALVGPGNQRLGSAKESEGTDLEKPMSHMEVADSTVMRKWIWLFVHGYECKSKISTAT